MTNTTDGNNKSSRVKSMTVGENNRRLTQYDDFALI